MAAFTMPQPFSSLSASWDRSTALLASYGVSDRTPIFGPINRFQGVRSAGALTGYLAKQYQHVV